MPKFKIDWKVVELSGQGDKVLARGSVVKEGDPKKLHDELMVLLRSSFSKHTQFSDREFVINVIPHNE